MLVWIGYALTGLVAGGLSSLLGIGGGLLMVLGMVYFFGFSQKMAQGTSLAVMIPPVGLLAAIQYYRDGNVAVRPAIVMAVFFVAGSYLIAGYVKDIPDYVLKRAFGIFLAFAAGQMLFAGSAGAGTRAALLAGGAAAAAVGAKTQRKKEIEKAEQDFDI